MLRQPSGLKLAALVASVVRSVVRCEKLTAQLKFAITAEKYKLDSRFTTQEKSDHKSYSMGHLTHDSSSLSSSFTVRCGLVILEILLHSLLRKLCVGDRRVIVLCFLTLLSGPKTIFLRGRQGMMQVFRSLLPLLQSSQLLFYTPGRHTCSMPS